ncbi:MAG: ROK family protein [Nitrospiraceae bacterium]|nr:ROK family protein [Nitrospiraceae bacterium]
MTLGVDIGGTFIKFFNGKDKWKVKTPPFAEEILEVVSDAVNDACIRKVGIAVAGLVNAASGVLTDSPNIKVLKGINLRKEVERRTGKSVLLFNDANAAAYGEFMAGAGRRSNILICLTIGTGFGGGAVINGKPLLGVSGCAMEVGHMVVEKGGWPCHCGRRGCLEAYVSSYGLRRFYLMAKGECPSSFEIIERAKRGEGEAVKSLSNLADFLSVGLVNILHLFNPDRIVISGGIAVHYPPLVKEARDLTVQRAFKLPASSFEIKVAELGEFSGAVGVWFLAQGSYL